MIRKDVFACLWRTFEYSILEDSRRRGKVPVMSKLLLTVEDTFQIKGLGLVVVPSVRPELIQGGTLKSGYTAPVLLLRPRKQAEVVEATFYWQHLNAKHGPIPLELVCTFKTMQKDQVPIGTEVWLLDENAP